MDEKEIYERLREIFSKVLEIETSEIHEESSLFNDLGIESIDLLELTFSIEDAFDIEIAPGELWNVGIDFLDDERYLVDEALTREGIDELKRRFPLLDDSTLRGKVDVREVFALITMNMIVQYITTKVKGEGT